MKKIIFFSLFSIFFSLKGFSQCAMCKAVVESGDAEIAQGLNNGIMYLMIFPYLLIGALFYFIYRHKTKNKN